MISEQIRDDLRSPWLRSILAVVGVTVLVNIGFISYAFISPPNLVAQDYYERGKNYFHDKAARKQASNQAWRMHLLLPSTMTVNTPVKGRFYVVDHDNKTVNDGQVVLTAYRPSNAEHDFRIHMRQQDKGTFVATFSFPYPGNWDLIARIDANGETFDVAERVFVEK